MSLNDIELALALAKRAATEARQHAILADRAAARANGNLVSAMASGLHTQDARDAGAALNATLATSARLTEQITRAGNLLAKVRQ